MNKFRNPNDIMTDDVALGPGQIIPPTKTATSYSQPGLPKPPAGWNRVLGTSDESIKEAPDTRPDDKD